MRLAALRDVVARVVVVAVLAAPAVASGKECGGAVPCACGDAVRGTAVLTADLTGCTNGLRVKSGVLDCDGHTISGAVPGGNEGVVVEATGAAVRGCTVSGFKTGIRVRGGGGNRIEDNAIVGNSRYGIELAVATTGNAIVDNVVLDSGDEGIHVGTAADANVFTGNEISRSKRENLYLLDVERCRIEGNRITGGGSAAIYAKHARANVFADNVIEDRPVQLRGESDANVFTGNQLDGAGFLFQAYKDAKRGWKAPRDNTVQGGAVLDVATCFRFDGASANAVSGVRVDRCKPFAQKKAGGLTATANAVDVERE
jgi:parallel beta-helix repeat protein